MKKQSGFTLIELMVVMAIIAILATAGLSAYTGYIKKARDTTRIADLAALETIILSSMGTNGNPVDDAAFQALVESMNNGVMIEDPMAGKNICYWSDDLGVTYISESCGYWYFDSDECGSGNYMIRATFESESNKGLMKPGNATIGEGSYLYYWVGNCPN